MKNGFSRRNFLKGLGIAGAAAATSNLPFGMREAFAQAAPGSKKAVVIVRTTGGFNALFGSAGSFITPARFGVTAGNTTDLGSGVIADAAFVNGLGAGSAAALTFVRSHFGVLGCAHGSTDHGNAQNLAWLDGAGASYPLMLASAMGGDASIKCAAVGNMFNGNHPAYNGTSVQRINDMAATITALKGGGATEPNRAVGAIAALGAQKYSQPLIGANPKSLSSVKDGHNTLITTLNKAAPPFDFAAIPTAYGVPTGIQNNNMRSMMAGAELMVRAGANVVTCISNFAWDSHGDTQGTNVRNQMAADILPGVSLFIQRMMIDAAAEYDVTLLFTGDFSRSLPGSDHQGNLTEVLIGPSVKTGTTGNVDGNVRLPVGTPAFQGRWSHLANMAGLASNPFGPTGSFHAALKR